METRIFNFEENDVTFVLSKDNNVMVNATEMAKVYGKKVNEFLSNEITKNFIAECLKSGNSRFINISKEEDLYRSSQKAGTFMHRILAMKFAAWLNPRFELWVYSTIESLLFGKHVERERSFERTLDLQNEMKDLEERIFKTGDDFIRYLEIKGELNREKSFRTLLTKESINELQLMFNTD